MNEQNEIIQQRPLPGSPDTERMVLATLMRYNELFLSEGDLLAADLFTDGFNAAIFRTIKGSIEGGNGTTIPALYDYSRSHKVGATLDVSDFANLLQYCSPASFPQDVSRLRGMRDRRKLWQELATASAKALDPLSPFEDTVNRLKEVIAEIESAAEGEKINFSDALDELTKIVNDNAAGVERYISTGLLTFDENYLLTPGSLTVIAAFTSVGKSALAMNITASVARQNIGVAYYSLEMGKAELAAREISKSVGLPASYILNKNLNEKPNGADVDYMGRFNEVVKKERYLPIYIDERSTADFDRTIRSIRAMKQKKNIGLAIIDYLQIYNQKAESTEAALAAMARGAKNIAKELDIPIILLSQLNRSADHPSRRMLRGSGQIEESADNILLIDRPEAEQGKGLEYEGDLKGESTKGTAAFILAKVRNGKLGSRLVNFDERTTQFSDIK